MKDTVIPIIEVILIITASIGIGFGVDLKKWHGWLFVLIGFISGYMLGGDITTTSGIVGGVFVALMVLIIGPIQLKRRRIAWGEESELQKKK
jgi:hypothetical protein